MDRRKHVGFTTTPETWERLQTIARERGQSVSRLVDREVTRLVEEHAASVKASRKKKR